MLPPACGAAIISAGAETGKNARRGRGRCETAACRRQSVAVPVAARLIVRDLPETARHDIGYRNAWKLLTGRDWK